MKKESQLGYRANRNILIEEYKSIYFHIPKNGCTSVKNHLYNLVGDGNHEVDIHEYDFPFVPVDLLKTDYKDFLKFAFVRNPWSRLVSCYNNKIRSSELTNAFFTNGIHNGFKRFKGLFYGDMPFNEFVDAVCSIPDSKADVHFISQLFWLTDLSGELLPNYIGRLEKLELAIDDIYQKSGLSLHNMSVKNQSKQKAQYTEYYDEDLKEKVRERYAGDIEVFGYQFESNAILEPIGFVDNALLEKIANSKHLNKLLKEKKEEIKLNGELNHKSTNSNSKSKKVHGQRATSLVSKFLNFFKLQSPFSKNKQSNRIPKK